MVSRNPISRVRRHHPKMTRQESKAGDQEFVASSAAPSEHTEQNIKHMHMATCPESSEKSQEHR